MTYFPLAPLMLLGDVPPPLPPGAPWWAQYALAVAPLVGWFVFSSIVAAINDTVRKADAEGVPVTPRFRFVLSVLNRIAANHDKAREQKAIASGEAAPRPAAKGGES